MPPRSESTTRVLPPGVPAKVACSTDSPSSWVTAMAPPVIRAPLSTDRREACAAAKSRQQSRSPLVWFISFIAAASAGHVVGSVEQGDHQPREQPAAEVVL